MSSAAASIPRRAAAVLLALPLALPLLLLALRWGEVDATLWQHLGEHVLPAVVRDTALLALGLGLAAAVLGVGAAWLTACCEFPGRRWLEWALVLPLALPGYVVAFAWIGLLDYAGPVQSAWRALGGAAGALPDPRGLGGAIVLLSLVLYPYVYLLARAAFRRQGAAAFEAARSLGAGPMRAFLSVAVPMARPAWAAGLALALLEALADFGAVSVLGVDTLTTTIYKAWFGFQSLATAAQLATLLLAGVVMVLVVERLLRGRARYAPRDGHRTDRIRLARGRGLAAATALSLVVAAGFVLPVGQLLSWAAGAEPPARLFSVTVLNTLALAAIVAIAVTAMALALALLERRAPRDPWIRVPVFMGNLGYAVPGTVLAVAMMLLMVHGERLVASATGVELGLTTGVAGLVLALLVRFARVGYGSIESGLAQLRPSMSEAAASLGAGRWRRLREVALPLLRPSLVAALLLVLVETMKEMPATLMLRPFGWDTLAVRIYAFTSEGLWAEAAWPALLLVAVGLLPVWMLLRQQR